MQLFKRIRDIITSRLFVTSFLILLQIIALILPFLYLGMRSVYIHAVVGFISTVISLSKACALSHHLDRCTVGCTHCRMASVCDPAA